MNLTSLPYTINRLAFSTWRRSVLTVCVLLLLSFIGLLGMRSTVRVKNMVDSGSEGSEFVTSAYEQSSGVRRTQQLVAASGHFAQLEQALDHWSWIIETSRVSPPVRRQFVTMDVIADSGKVIVQAVAELSGPDDVGLSDEIIEQLCEAGDRLRSVDRGAYFQLVKTADELLELAESMATDCEQP